MLQHLQTNRRAADASKDETQPRRIGKAKQQSNDGKGAKAFDTHPGKVRSQSDRR
jgi:hypothetical protein